MIGSLLAAAEERWIVSAYSSPNPRAWMVAHEWVTFPLRLRRELRRYSTAVADRSLRIVTIGAPKRVRGFCEHLLGSLNEVADAGRGMVWRPTAGGDPDADLVVAEIHPWTAPWFRRAGWRIVPDAVRWQGALASVPPTPPSKSLRDDLRKIRQHDYQLERGESAADWDEFYATMVVPHSAQRFGDEAWVPSAAFLRALRKVALLHFVQRRGVRVGGFCLVPSKDFVWCPLLGTLAGDETLRREGAIAAVYAFGIQWAKTHGYRYIDKGRTSAFVNDGVATYKRKWGLAPVADPLGHLFAVHAGPDPAIAEAFAREPVWIETDAGLAEFPGGGF